MITDTVIVYNSDIQISRLKESSLQNSPYFVYIDERTVDGKKAAFKLKHQYAAKQTPFVVCFNKEKPIRAFYSESEDAIESMLNYLNSL